MKIRRIKESSGLNCPFVICEGCDKEIRFVEGQRPVVIVSRPGDPAFHQGCDPGDRGELALYEVLRDLGWNSSGLTGGVSS